LLERLLLYLRQVNCPHQVVVADSSSARGRDSNSTVIASVQDHLNIEHQLHDPETGFFPKIARALGKTDSKYSVICADDDFLVPGTVEECARFLEHNPDYAAARGLILSIYPSNIAPSISKLWTHRLSQHTIDNADPSQRLHEHLREYEATFYSVYRRTQLMRNMELASKRTRDYRFGELLLSCLGIIQGKLKHLNMLHGIRPYNPDSTTGSHPSWTRPSK
jgi:glycosyltransferase domain-containing protein